MDSIAKRHISTGQNVLFEYIFLIFVLLFTIETALLKLIGICLEI